MDDDEEHEIIIESIGGNNDESCWIKIEASYRAWTKIDSQIWIYSKTVRHLDVSYNALTELPLEINQLKQLETLNVSCNRIETIDNLSFCGLNHLQTLKANGNRLQQIPHDIGYHCPSLTTIILSENSLDILPYSLGNCSKLRTILVQNNNLNILPISLGRLYNDDTSFSELQMFHNLKQIDVSNNNKLLEKMIPSQLQSDTDAIIWILYRHYSHSKKKSNLTKYALHKFQKMENQLQEEEQIQLQHIHSLNQEKEALLASLNLLNKKRQNGGRLSSLFRRLWYHVETSFQNKSAQK